MPRATTKAELLSAASTQYAKLRTLIDGLSDEMRLGTFQFEDRDKNIRDVLIHLYEWHQLLLNWVHANQLGDPKPFLPEPYNWKTYPQMNVGFWEKHQNTPYETADQIFEKSHSDVMKLIETFTDEKLFTKKYFPWTGTTSLGSYCISATSSHYDWAMKKIKLHVKTWNGEEEGTNNGRIMRDEPTSRS